MLKQGITAVRIVEVPMLKKIGHTYMNIQKLIVINISTPRRAYRKNASQGVL
jgi:hypothetical protein